MYLRLEIVSSPDRRALWSAVLKFSEVFDRALKRAKLKQLPFAKKANTAQGFVSELLAGKKLAPLEKLDVWAEVLDLKGGDRAEFYRAAWLDHCPPEIADDYRRLRALVDKLERRVAEFEEKYKA